jgi:hypothetical protein
MEGGHNVLKIVACVGVVAAIALAPISVLAQTSPPAPTKQQSAKHTPTRSYRSEMRARHNSSRERARASAEHVRMMRQQQ